MALSIHQLAQACCITTCYMEITQETLDKYFSVSRIAQWPQLKAMLKNRLALNEDIKPSIQKRDNSWLRALGADIHTFAASCLFSHWFDGDAPRDDCYAIAVLAPLLMIEGYLEHDPASGGLRLTVLSKTISRLIVPPTVIGSPATVRPIQLLFDRYFSSPLTFDNEVRDTGINDDVLIDIYRDCFTALCALALSPKWDERFTGDWSTIETAARLLSNLTQSILPLWVMMKVYQRLNLDTDYRRIEVEVFGALFRSADVASMMNDTTPVAAHPQGACKAMYEARYIESVVAAQAKSKSRKVIDFGKLASTPNEYIQIGLGVNRAFNSFPPDFVAWMETAEWPSSVKSTAGDYANVMAFVRTVCNALDALLTTTTTSVDNVDLAITVCHEWLKSAEAFNVAYPGKGENARERTAGLRIALFDVMSETLKPYSNAISGCRTAVVKERMSIWFASLASALQTFSEDELPGVGEQVATIERLKGELGELIDHSDHDTLIKSAIYILVESSLGRKMLDGQMAMANAVNAYKAALEAYTHELKRAPSAVQMRAVQTALSTATETMATLEALIADHVALSHEVVNEARQRLVQQTDAAPQTATTTPEDTIKALEKRLSAMEEDYLQALERESALGKKLAAAQHALEEVRRPAVTSERTDARRLIDALACSSAAGSLSVADVVDLAEVLWPERLRLSREARAIAAESPFERPIDVLHAIYLLSHDYLDALAGPGGEERAKRVFPPAQYALSESETTLSSAEHRAARVFSFDGTEHLCLRHIKIGTARDPKHCARIYFTVGDGKILLGAAGQHLALPGAK